MLSPIRTPPFERILAFGTFGAGKTYAWLTIAKWAHRTKSNSQFWVIDTDAAIERMLFSEDFKEIRDRVHTFPAFEWPEYEQGLQESLENAGTEDWIVVDMIGKAWEAVQTYYVNEVFEQDIGEYFLAARKAMRAKKTLNAFEGWTDWQVINRLYTQWAGKLIYKAKCHVFAVTPEDRLMRDAERDVATLSSFGDIGFKPSGQKHLGHQFHTVLRFHYGKPEDWRITTVKDRERDRLIGKQLKDFVLDYMIKVAHWKL